jgi:hypothetical protein
VQVKAQGLLNAAKYIEDEYGRDALGAVIRACSPEVRDRYTSAIAINWHPMEELVELVQRADELLGRGNGKVAEAVGAAGARANMRGLVVRIATYLAQPQFFMRRVAGLWQQFNDEGEMLVRSLGDKCSVLEIRGLSAPHPIFCAILTGWVREVGRGIGIHEPMVRHAECRCRGDARCTYEVRWETIDEREKEAQSRAESLARIPTSRPPSSDRISTTTPFAMSRSPLSSPSLRAQTPSRPLSTRPSSAPRKPGTDGSDDDA